MREIFERLIKLVNAGDSISRQEGDEFIILLNDTSKKAAIQFSQKLLGELHKPFVVEGNKFMLTSSIGIAMYPYDGLSVEELIKNAESTVSFAKEKGKNRYEFYSKVLSESNERMHLVETHLKHAIENN